MKTVNIFFKNITFIIRNIFYCSLTTFVILGNYVCTVIGNFNNNYVNYQILLRQSCDVVYFNYNKIFSFICFIYFLFV